MTSCHSKAWRPSNALPLKVQPQRAFSAIPRHAPPCGACLWLSQKLRATPTRHPLHHTVRLAPWVGLFFQGINVFYGEIKCTIIKRGRGVFPQAHILSKGAVIWHPWLEYEIITQELTLGVADAPWDDCFYNLWRQLSVCIQVIT